MSAIFQTIPSTWGRIAAGVQHAVQVEREAIFPAGELMPVSLPEMARVPYVGWVGPRFAGTLIVGKNPGGGGDAQVDVKPHDRAVAEALMQMKAVPGSGAGAALYRVYEAFTAQAPTIGMGTLLGRVLNALGEQRETVAFVNLCPYRTRMDMDPSAAAIRRCASLVLVPIVKALQPDTVVLLGGVAGKAEPHVTARWIYKMKRRINDHQLHPEAALRLDEMRASRAERAALRMRR